MKSEGCKREGRLGAASVKGDTGSCKEETGRPQGSGDTQGLQWGGEVQRAAKERRDPGAARERGRPGVCKQPHHSPFPVPAPHPHPRSFGDAPPLKQANALSVRAAGWQGGQVDVCPFWVRKLEKCEMDTHTLYIVNIACSHPWDEALGGVRWDYFLCVRLGLSANSPRVKRKGSF